jgi:hypothetical protein
MRKDMHTCCVDFDGVLNTYKGWRGVDELYEPRVGVAGFLQELSQSYNVIVFTARDAFRVEEWMVKHGLRQYVSHVTNVKPGASVYVDDRAVCYRGESFGELLETIKAFRPFWYAKD